MRAKSKRKTVIRSAVARTDGLMLFDISHNTSSASTAASAMVDEKVSAERRLMLSRETMVLEPLLLPDSRLFKTLSPVMSGSSLCWTTADTSRKVNRKGNNEKIIDVNFGVAPPGRHSSQAEGPMTRSNLQRTLSDHVDGASINGLNPQHSICRVILIITIRKSGKELLSKRRFYRLG